MNAQKLRWNDLRLVMAVARAGSLSGAGRALGVNHATIFRQLGDIERRLGVELFQRGRSGYTPTPAGEDVAAAASRVEHEVLAVERRIVGRDRRPFGTVRITTTDTLLTGLLSPLFANFQRAFPEIALEIAVSNQVFNLSRREADIAIRPSTAPPETLVGRKAGTIAQAVYAAAEGADGLDNRSWIGPDEGLGYRQLNVWMERHGHWSRCRYRVDTVHGMTAAVRAGLGVAVLPCYLADPDTQLRRLGVPIPDLATDLWLLTHADLSRVARIAVLMDHLATALRRLRPRLQPE